MGFEREQIGACTLYRGDCRDILPTLNPGYTLITDPPYGVHLTCKSNSFRGSRSFDDRTPSQVSTLYEDSPASVESLIHEALIPAIGQAKRAAIFPGYHMLFAYPKPASMGTVYVPRGTGRDPWGFGCHNSILYYGKDPYLATRQGSRPNSFWSNRPSEKGINHPCPKPLSWMLWIVNRASLPGEVVLDPLMGSGTTGVACVQLERSFVGIEIEPRYFDIACARIQEAQRQGLLFPSPAAPQQLRLVGASA